MTQGYDTERQVNYLIFVGVVVGMVLLCLAVMAGITTVRVNHRDDGVTKRAKYEACSSIEHEASRLVCVNGWSR